MDHETVGSGAVPVVLVGLKEDAVSGANDLDRAAALLAEADAFGDVDGLSEGMRVPRGAGAGGEVHEVGLRPRGGGCCSDRVYVDVAGEPLLGAFGGVDAASCDLHVNEPPVDACFSG